MDKTPYRIVLLTSDRYDRAVLPFAWLLEKHWPAPRPEVVVAGFTPPSFDLPDGFTFHSIGAFADYPIGKWSDALIKLLDELPDEVFLWMLEDMWTIRDVNTRVVQMAYDYCQQFEYVARFDLTGDRLHAGGAQFYGKLGDVDLIFSDPVSQYHLSTMPAFWRKAHLQRVLVHGETPWQLEIQGTPRLGQLRNEMIVLGTGAWPVRNTLAFRGGEPGKLLLDELSPDDLQGLREAGLLAHWEGSNG